MKIPKAVLALLAVSSFFLSVQGFAQSQSADAHLVGSLSDPSGAAIAEATIVAQAESRSSSPQTAVSGSDGAYNLTLAPGPYHVVISKDGFQTRESEITVRSGETFTLNATMNLARMSSSVLVTGQIAPTMEEQSPAPSSILTSEQITQQQAITLADLLNTQPGIAVARTGPIGGLTTLFLDGGNSNYTKVIIDGTPANEPGGNFDYSNLSLDNVDKVEVVHGAESTLYDSDAMSGVIQLFSHRGVLSQHGWTRAKRRVHQSHAGRKFWLQLFGHGSTAVDGAQQLELGGNTGPNAVGAADVGPVLLVREPERESCVDIAYREALAAPFSRMGLADRRRQLHSHPWRGRVPVCGSVQYGGIQ
jgi:hypothetical protein